MISVEHLRSKNYVSNSLKFGFFIKKLIEMIFLIGKNNVRIIVKSKFANRSALSISYQITSVPILFNS